MTEKQRHPGPSDTYVDVIPSRVWIKSICSGTIWKDTSVDGPVTSSLTVSTNHQLQSSHRSWSRDSSLTVVLAHRAGEQRTCSAVYEVSLCPNLELLGESARQRPGLDRVWIQALCSRKGRARGNRGVREHSGRQTDRERGHS